MRMMTTLSSKMSRPAAFCVLTVAVMCWAAPATADVVIQAERAAVEADRRQMCSAVSQEAWRRGQVQARFSVAPPIVCADNVGAAQSTFQALLVC
jgi:P pilus assembly chaperone PapD